MNFEYIKNFYDVQAELGMLIKYKDKTGIIAEDRGNYIGVNFDDNKPGDIRNVHPTDPNLIFLNKYGKIRKMTRSQQRYYDYRMSEYPGSFREYLGIKDANGRY